jgi:hypothetical protein
MRKVDANKAYLVPPATPEVAKTIEDAIVVSKTPSETTTANDDNEGFSPSQIIARTSLQQITSPSLFHPF